MSLYRWFIKIKLMVNARINYNKLTSEYLKNNRRKAAEEIKHLKGFTHWPIAKVKPNSVLNNPKSIAGTENAENKLHYLPFYTYQKEAYIQNKILEKAEVKLTNINKIKKTYNKK